MKLVICVDCGEKKQHKALGRCKKCYNKYWWHKNGKKVYKTRRKYHIEKFRKRRKVLKRKIVEYKGGKCSICGYNKCDAALDFHHVDRKDKNFNISSEGLKKSWEKLKLELDKCILICANCHRELHVGLINVY